MKEGAKQNDFVLQILNEPVNQWRAEVALPCALRCCVLMVMVMVTVLLCCELLSRQAGFSPTRHNLFN